MKARIYMAYSASATTPTVGGVYGTNDAGFGVQGESKSGRGVFGHSETGHAGFFDGNVHVTRNITVDGDIVLSNADCAEDFDTEDEGDAVLPGTVMVLGEGGALRRSDKPYDRRVVGVVSGAGRYKPGIVLDRQPNAERRRPIALFGKVYCQVDADHGPIEIGDLLTTSSTLGHAMAVVDFARMPGTMIGKAMGALASGRGLIPVLVTMR